MVRRPPGRWAAWILAHSGDAQWWLVGGLGLWWLANAELAGTGKRLVAVTLAAGLVSAVLKRAFGRTRPGESGGLLYLAFDRHSFPSGHAVRVGGIAAVLASSMPWAGNVAMAVWLGGVCASRVALQVHYPSDVVGGVLVGLCVGALVRCWC